MRPFQLRFVKFNDGVVNQILAFVGKVFRANVKAGNLSEQECFVSRTANGKQNRNTASVPVNR